jgi:hypothetical protein
VKPFEITVCKASQRMKFIFTANLFTSDKFCLLTLKINMNEDYISKEA